MRKYQIKSSATIHEWIRTPAQIYQWERNLFVGRLRPNKRSIATMQNKPEKTKKELQDEDDYLRAQVAYLDNSKEEILNFEKAQLVGELK